MKKGKRERASAGAGRVDFLSRAGSSPAGPSILDPAE